MSGSREIYTPGYSEPTLRMMLKRTAATHAAFFIPVLHRGMRVLNCVCGPGTITLDLDQCPNALLSVFGTRMFASGNSTLHGAGKARPRITSGACRQFARYRKTAQIERRAAHYHLAWLGSDHYLYGSLDG
jgi:hypothetical protein